MNINFHIVSRALSALIILSALALGACEETNPNTNKVGEDILTSHETSLPQQSEVLSYADTIYVPIYSDIYLSKTSPKSLLTATLSIRNSSFSDSLYVSTIDYYDTKGNLVRSYLDKPILLNPMESIDYVIEKEDESGGSGANFILILSAEKKSIKPIIQAVMIGHDGNKGFAFTTEGYSISRN